jgi:formylmethanofuran dehydrogenase subunit A
VTPARIISSLAAIVDELKLPHPMHIHCNNLGVPGNFTTTIDTMNVIDGHRAHLAHLQFHAYGGDDWSSMRSESARVAEAFNVHKHLTTDAGAVLFGDAVTITADGPWQHLLYQLTGHKWGNLDVENETGCGIVPYVYKDRNLVNAVQWAVGLELLLLIEDPWRIFLTTDHPNGACFWRYPEIVQLLTDAEFRKAEVKKLPAKAQQRIVLGDLDREYTMAEIAIITSAGPARSLGLTQKGHLGPGADADVTIYHEKPEDGRLFTYPRYVIKSGEIVVEDGDVRAATAGREFVVHPACDEQIEGYLRNIFPKVYTISFENYPVAIDRLRHAQIQPCL